MEFSTDDKEAFQLAVTRVFGDLSASGLKAFLKHIKASPEVIKALDLASHPGGLSERLEASLKVTRAIIDTHLLEALLGGAWPMVPVDWGDHK